MKNKKILTVQTLRRRKAFIIFFFCALAVVFTVYFSVFCRVDNIIIENNERISNVAILQTVDIMPGRHLFSVNTRKLEKNIKSISPYVKDVNVIRKLPSEFIISVEEYDAAYYIEKDGICYLLSENLYVLESCTFTEMCEKEHPIPALLHIPEIKPIEMNKELTFVSKTEGKDTYALLAVFAESGLVKSLSELDLTALSAITAEVSGRYHIALGTYHEMKEKLSFVSECVSYLEQNMGSVAGTLHVHSPEETTFEITGVSGNS